LVEGQSHSSNFLLLLDDDLLRNSPQLLVVAVEEFSLCHVNRTLMMGDHHGRKVTIYIAAGFRAHTGHHLVHCSLIGGQELRFPIRRR
jgi:hypothetical protein